jgi:hypothetical protein
MPSLGHVLEIALFVSVVAIPGIGIAWAIAGRDGFTLAELFRIPSDAPWPRGVQEEQPVQWRLEQLDRSRI